MGAKPPPCFEFGESANVQRRFKSMADPAVGTSKPSVADSSRRRTPAEVSFVRLLSACERHVFGAPCAPGTPTAVEGGGDRAGGTAPHRSDRTAPGSGGTCQASGLLSPALLPKFNEVQCCLGGAGCVGGGQRALCVPALHAPW